VDELRVPLLKPFKASFQARNRVALHLFTHGSWVIENFNDEPVDVTLNGQAIHIVARAWSYRWN
jgi:hypothetical protein